MPNLTTLPVSVTLPDAASLYALDLAQVGNEDRQISVADLRALLAPKISLELAGVDESALSRQPFSVQFVFGPAINGANSFGVIPQLSTVENYASYGLQGMTLFRIVSGVTFAMSFNFDGAVLETVDFGPLKWVNDGSLSSSALTDFTADELEILADALTFSATALTALDFPALVRGIIRTNANTSLASLEAPSLIVGAFQCDSDSALALLDFSSLQTAEANLLLNFTAATALNLPALVNINFDFFVNSNPDLAVVSVPALERCAGAINIIGNPSLVSANLGSIGTLLEIGGDCYCNDNALDGASVDAILELLASLDGTGGTVLFENKTVELSGGTNAAPGVAGLAAKAILEGRGCTVAVNP